MRQKPKVITLCGSSKYKDEFDRIAKEETLKGNIVLSLHVFGHLEGMDMAGPVKKMLDDLHFSRIDMSDAIYVINPDGRIGLSTCGELWYAAVNDKEIMFMNKPENWDELYRDLIRYDYIPELNMYIPEIWKNEPLFHHPV